MSHGLHDNSPVFCTSGALLFEIVLSMGILRVWRRAIITIRPRQVNEVFVPPQWSLRIPARASQNVRKQRIDSTYAVLVWQIAQMNICPFKRARNTETLGFTLKTFRVTQLQPDLKEVLTIMFFVNCVILMLHGDRLIEQVYIVMCVKHFSTFF